MASNTPAFINFLFLYSLILPLISTQNISPPIKTLVLPIAKHPSTLQYITNLYQRTPLVPINLVINLGGPFLWVSCDNSSYNSSSYRSANCKSPICSLTHKFLNIKPQCNDNICMIRAENVITSKISSGNLSIDVLSLRATDGLNPTNLASIPRFVFWCAPEFLLQGLPSEATGIVGLGHSQLSLPTQLANQFNFTRKFAICLSPSMNSNGVIFIGEEPYVLFPGIDVSKILIYTPLAITSKNVGEFSDPHEYWINVRYIRINGRHVPFNSSYTKIKTKISTINPYTILESSVYNSVTNYFIQEAIAANNTRVNEVAPFRVCFSTTTDQVGSITRPAMPFVDLMMQSELVFWRIFETNLMVPVNKNTACLGFLDGGINQKYGIIVGGYQLEDNFVQFDIEKSRLGFTSSLLLKETSCDSFNFTTTSV
ncbi:Basic 7S globulin [Heracleum sosnowskyi]|uniref:Basic 7S globulin n=1 Tax=Heracleum sosnowskyi TaxID=360622 RepID=A0AAD8HPR8_9APIA|nr:Basic 7S globulin [Heracleum sosnowskyi]